MLELSPINLERLTEMRAFLESYDGTLESWISNISKTFLKAMREVDGKETKYHLHCLRYTFAVRRLIQGASIYELKLLMGHSSVTTTIYDLMGRSIKSLVNSNQSAGYRSIQWNATNNLGEPVSAGMYFYLIQAGEFRQTKKMVLLK